MDLTKGNFRLVFHDIFLIDFFTTLFVVFLTVKNHAWSSKERKELARQRSTLEWSLELPTTKVWKKTERYQVGSRHIMYFTISCCCHLSLVSRFVNASSNPSEVKAKLLELKWEFPKITYSVLNILINITGSKNFYL